MERKVLIETKNLQIHFPVKKEGLFAKQKYLQAVSDVSVQIYRGETFGLVGESGCGKSTFASATLGLLTPTAGQVWFDGVELQQAAKGQKKECRKRMQKIFQDPGASLNPRFSVLELIEEPLVIRGGYSEKERKRLVLELVQQIGLSEADLYRYPSDFSGGQQQRIAIARALILKPEYLVCDEPVSALDVSVHAQILKLLLDMQKKLGVTYLFISHNLADVKKICDRLAIMYLGSVVEYGTADKIFANPCHPYSKALLAAVLDMDVEAPKKQSVLQGDIPSPIDPPAGCRFCSRCPAAVSECKVGKAPLIKVEEDHYAACLFCQK